MTVSDVPLKFTDGSLVGDHAPSIAIVAPPKAVPVNAFNPGPVSTRAVERDAGAPRSIEVAAAFAGSLFTTATYVTPSLPATAYADKLSAVGVPACL